MVFDDYRRVYLIGMKGVGMTALAQVLAARGVRVSGSDTAQHFFTQDVLLRAGIPFLEAFAAANVPRDAELVIRSSAYGEDHVEVAEARRRGIPVVTYAEAVAFVFNAGRGIAVCGTHGKTTTTAMLGWILAEAGLDPTVIVGSEVPQFGGNARVGKSELIVLEADEYQEKFLALRPHGIVLTNIEYDHPDYFANGATYVGAFRSFVRFVPADGFLVVNADDAHVRSIADAVASEVVWVPLRGAPLSLRLPGEHNQFNARAAVAAAVRLGVNPEVAARAVATFSGTKRRFEVVGEGAGVTVIDDYAHHPTEIRATIAAAMERYPERRILCAFHAHTYSRTIALKDDFACAFVGATQVFVMNIFGSARETRGGITAAELARAISDHTPAIASGGVEDTVASLLAAMRSGDVVLCLGAGENDRVARMVIERYAAKPS